jgi:glycosyltransferase involved in cell wall biosynthesis
MPTVALAMIVRNAAVQLERCLATVRGVVDEIVIGDTGSVDETPQRARQLGARVLQVPWKDDFAEARNRVLEAVTADWVLVLDADERLDAAGREEIPALMQVAGCDGYLVTIRNYVLTLEHRLWDTSAVPNDHRLPEADPYPAYVAHENVRLFRRRPEVYFVGRVHETVGGRIVELGGQLGRARFVIHHFGLVADPETAAQKTELYRRLGRQKILERPHDAQAYFELGLVEFDNYHNDTEAVRLFEQACRLNPGLAVAWLFLGLARSRLGEHGRALEAYAQARRLGYCVPLLDEAEGDAHYNRGEFESARRCYRRALEKAPARAELLSKLGLADVRAGRPGVGLQRLREAVALRPDLPEMHDRLMQALVWLDRLEEAAEVAEAKLRKVPPQPEDYLRAASIRARCGEHSRAAALVLAGLERFPRHERLRAVAAELQPDLLLVRNGPLAGS